MTEIVLFAIRTGYHFEKTYATGHKKGLITLSLSSHPDIEPNAHWISFPHPTLEASNIGLQTLRTLLAQGHEASAEKARQFLYM